MVFQPLALNPGVAAGEALALFAQPVDVRATVPHEKGGCVLQKRLALGRRVRAWVTAVGKQVLQVAFGVVPVLAACGVPGDFVLFDQAQFPVQAAAPEAPALDQVVGTSHRALPGAAFVTLVSHCDNIGSSGQSKRDEQVGILEGIEDGQCAIRTRCLWLRRAQEGTLLPVAPVYRPFTLHFHPDCRSNSP